MTEVLFTRLPISLPCPVPIRPGDPVVVVDGEPVDLEVRTERCHVDAFWMIGAQVTCDVHLRAACEVMGIEYAGLVRESEGGKPAAVEELPWEDRPRYPQEEPST